MGPRRVGPRKGGAPKGGAPKGGAPKGGAPKGGAQTVGAQNFALFFPSPATVFILFSLSFGLFRGILVVFEALGRSNVHVWTAREPKRAHLRVPVFKNITKIQRKRPKEREKRMKTVAGEGKKRAKFWAVRRRAVRWREGGPAEGGPAEGGPAEGGPVEGP